MYIINISFMVDYDIHQQWLEIMTNYYFPLLEERGFPQYIFTRVISIESKDHFTYSLQVPAQDMGQYQVISKDIFREFVNIAMPLFGDKLSWFISLMKHVEY